MLDASSDTIEVKRELKTVRRPLSASVTDDGSLLAVLSSKYQANIYALSPDSPVKHLQVIVLDNPPRSIALAHEGTGLAAAWAGGIEVFSLAHNALSTDRRAVRSEAVDSLMFSGDGSMLIGSSHDLEEPNAVVITAPFYTENDPNITSREIHSRMWTTQILFPQISSTVSHVALLPGHTEGDTNWLFAYDHTLMTYRASRTDDTRSGVAYFLSPPTEDRFEFPQPCIAPTATACGTLAAAGFAEYGLCVYGVPERLDISPDMGSVVDRNDEKARSRVALTSATGHIEPLMAYSPSVSGSSEMIDMEEEGLSGKVDWRQSLFVKSKSIRCIDGFTSARWVENSEDYPCEFPDKRLIVTAPAGVNKFADDLGEENMPVDGSRICLLDFNYGPSTHENREFTIEVGDNEAELLTEQLGNIEIEVAMERRRTVRATRGRNAAAITRATLGRSHTAASPPNPSYMDEVVRRNIVSQPSSPSEDIIASPLSRSSGLSRAQTAAGFQHARFPPRPPLGASYTDTSVHPVRLPHRASVDSWETPPPPYGQDGLAIPPFGQRPHSASQTSSHSATVNGNLSQLGTFGARSQQVQTSAGNQARLPPQPYVRQSTSMDGMMMTEHGPSRRAMSQYGGLARSPRPDGIPEEAAEHDPHHHFVRQRQQQRQSYGYPQSAISPAGGPDAYFSSRRPQTHDGPSPDEGTLGLRSTLTHPVSPPTPERQSWQEVQQQPPLPTPPSADRREHRVSLTGANLQNRLNHPVPPVPTNQSPASIYGPSQAQNISAYREAQQSQTQNMPTYSQAQQSQTLYATAPTGPSSEQMARLNRRQSPLPSPLQAGPPGHMYRNTASRDFGGAPPSPTPPRAAWGATGVPGSPTFNRAIATPNGLNRPVSEASAHSIGASRSTPNLLQGQFSPRPVSHRLDTINSVNSAMVPLEHERSHSVMGNEHMMYGRDHRMMSDPPIGIETLKKGKRGKHKGEGGKSGRRCIVM